MNNNFHVKEAPLQGFAGFGGGAGSNVNSFTVLAEIDSLTLAEDDASGNRYTSSGYTLSGSFSTMGIPVATQALKIKLVGDIHGPVVLGACTGDADTTRNVTGGTVTLTGNNEHGVGQIGDIFSSSNPGGQQMYTPKSQSNSTQTITYEFPANSHIYGDQSLIHI